MRGYHVTPDDIDRGLSIMARIRAAQMTGEAAPMQQGPLQPQPQHEGYCTGCRAKKTVVTIDTATAGKNGKSLMLSGHCPDCGTKVSTFSREP